MLIDRQARVRDGHGCAITKRFDLNATNAQMQDVQQRFPDFGLGEFTAIQACHIIPQGILSDMSGVDDPTDNYKVNSPLDLTLRASYHLLEPKSVPFSGSMGRQCSFSPSSIHFH